ncbi:hypothetical protein DY000_02008188 [Brassica cretica]|uniref:Retrotransposon gag domain-containing protein n=1 Tax=Brassica cretica TaxID=69181 RepID=A0ABQ7C8C9_BRACR|nr:hypothetical protein DY000_02008188 [Brassica cretica]
MEEFNRLQGDYIRVQPVAVGEYGPPGSKPSPQQGRQQEASFQHPSSTHGTPEKARPIKILGQAYLGQSAKGPRILSDGVLYDCLSREDVLHEIRRHAVHGGTPTKSSSSNQKEQGMLAVALPKKSHKATMCKGFGSTLIGPALQWYINLPTRSISSFASLSDNFVEQFASSRSLEKISDGLYEILQHRVKPLRDYIARFNQEKVAVLECSIPTAISAIKRALLPDGGLYKELTMYPCKTMEDVLSRAWAQVKWEENVASRAKAQPKQDQKSARSDQGNRDEKSSQRATKDSRNRNQGRFQYRPLEKEEGMSVSTWPDISHLSISTPELVNVLSQMGQQVKWPQKMKAPDSFRNPGLWCDFHRDHGHKTEDCVALRIEVNELLQKGHLREFLLEKAKNHLNKEVPAKSAGAIPASPPHRLKGEDQGLIAITEETSGPANPGTRGQEVWRMAIGSEDADPESREGPPKDRYRPLHMV